MKQAPGSVKMPSSLEKVSSAKKTFSKKLVWRGKWTFIFGFRY
jgi:hypothetical protein